MVGFRRNAVLIGAFGGVVACSLTADFDRYASAWDDADGSDAGVAHDGAGLDAEAGVDGGRGAASCAEADPLRLFCSAFDGPTVEAGWTKLLLKDPAGGDLGALDIARSLSAPSSGRFVVGSGVNRYAELLKEITPSAMPSTVEASAQFFVDQADVGTLTLLSFSYDDQVDNVSISVAGAALRLQYKGASTFDTVPLGVTLPVGRFFSVVVRREETSTPRVVSVELDGVSVGAPHPLQGVRPSATRIELRAGIVYAENHPGPVTVWADDIAVRRR